MSLKSMLSQIEKFTTDNSPEILTAFGVVGVVSTAYLSGRAAIKATRLVEEFDQDPYEPMTAVELVDLTWTCFVPPLITGGLTIGCILGANHISNRRASALAMAYTISDRAFAEYKERVVEKIGNRQEQEIRDEVAQAQVDRNPVSEQTVIMTGQGEVLCYEHFSGRYFKSDMETLRKAENDINFQIVNEGHASVSDLYFLLGLKPTSISEEVGWNTDYPLSIVYSTTMSEDNTPCISIDFDLHPRRKYSHYAGT